MADTAKRYGLKDLEATSLELPGWMKRGVLLPVFFSILVAVIGTGCLPWQQTLGVPVVITSSSPPRTVRTPAADSIAAIFVGDGRRVQRGTPLAQLGQPHVIREVDALEKYADRVVAFIDGKHIPPPPPLFTIGGELQPAYSNLSAALTELRAKLLLNDDAVTLELLKKQAQALNERIQILSRDAKLNAAIVDTNSELLRIKSRVAADGWISQAGLTDAKAAVLQSEVRANQANLLLHQTQSDAMRAKLEFLQAQIRLNSTREDTVQRARRAAVDLIGALKGWRESRLLVAPIDGVVNLPEPRFAGQTLPGGAEFAVVVPVDSDVIAVGDVATSAPSDIGIGSEARLTLPSHPSYRDGEVIGRVDNVAQVATAKAYTIRIALPNGLRTTQGVVIPLRQRAEARALIVTRRSSLFDFVLTGLFRSFDS